MQTRQGAWGAYSSERFVGRADQRKGEGVWSDVNRLDDSNLGCHLKWKIKAALHRGWVSLCRK